MASAELVPLRDDPTFKEVVEATNRLVNVLNGNQPGKFELRGDDGVKRNIRGGATLSTGNYALKVFAESGLHIHVRDSTDSYDAFKVEDELVRTVVPVVEFQTIGGGFSGVGTRIKSNFANATLALRGMFQSTASAETTVGALPPSGDTTAGWVAYNNSTPASASVEATMRAVTGAMELRAASPSGSYQPMDFYTSATRQVRIDTAGLVTLTQNLAWQSGGANAITLDHAATGARTATFQDLTGTVALLGVANAGGHLLFTDNTYDIGASGATRPRNLFLAGNATVGGTLGVTGVTTFTAAPLLPTVDPPTADAQATAESVCKGYVYFTGGATPSLGYAYNVSSVTQSATGVYVVNWDRDFALAVYAVVVAYESASTLISRITAQAVGSVTVRFETTAGVATDPDSARVIAFGTLS